jgi:phosphohistidine phosphatase SixA
MDGERAFRRAAQGLAEVAEPARTVLASPYERAWRTAELLHEEADWPAAERFEPLEADSRAEDALEALAAWSGSGPLALVGHEPLLGQLCGVLSGGSDLELKKGAVVRLTVERFEPGGALLRWLLPPKVLRRLGSRGT